MSKKKSKLKNELFLEVLFYGVNTYLLALLVYVTGKYVFTLKSDELSALGSIVSASATFFAALVAVLIFKEWKKQARYMDSLKLIAKINLETNNLFHQINSKRSYFTYESYYRDKSLELIHSKSFNEGDTGLIHASERSKEICKFKESLHSINYSFSEIKNTLEELSAFINQDLSNEKESIETLVNETLKDLVDAYTSIMLFFVGGGTIPNSSYPKSADENDLRFASNVLGDSSPCLISHMKSSKQQAFKNYLKEFNNNYSGQKIITFAYNDVLDERKAKIVNIVKLARDRYVE